MKKLAIVGASYLQLPLVEKAKSMGIETHCFAWDDGAVCKMISDYFYPISVLDKENILMKCQEIGIDGITTIATDIAIPTICYVAQKMNLISNSLESSLRTTNKGIMKNRFIEYGIVTPKSLQIEAYQEEDFRMFSFPLIVKPIDRSGSLGVCKVDNAIGLEQAVKEAITYSFQKKCVVEEFIEGKEVSVESISWKGNHKVLAITDKVVTKEPYFVELAHHQPAVHQQGILDRIEDITEAVLNAVNVEYGAGHTELMITPEGKIYVIEIGARMGGDFIGSHLVQLSTEYDFLKAVIEVALGNFILPDRINNKTCSGVYFLSHDTRELLPYFEKDNVFDVQKVINNDNLIAAKSSNDRSGYLIYSSPNKIDLL
ncbi:hypothetical protein DBR32_03795 [Taibaiella sp. KBW10]|uniref:ATP-grasp domain-containing protein n=1 Tax=Taibaiella sp. KBW10 TaxID=2153357 RepID=UPI000F5B1A24|nr:ATP-grasp domain-containing protein [Taibaiella sp. KBW10]RQO31939.1 hypothetical protein DBR32_03795 [Taibaiella sp. KBW10]